ncbi:MAG: ABC transporter substrate-binding protein [Ancrocorticia sp.]
MIQQKPLRPLRSALVASAAIFALTLSACGSSADQKADDDAATSPAESTGFPVVIEHEYGETEIPDEPERIVALPTASFDPLISLGLEPVAFAADEQTLAQMPWIKEHVTWEADGSLLAAGEINVEKIATYEPDLIIAPEYAADEKTWERLEDIAPTIIFSDTNASSWQDNLATIARATGSEAKVPGILSDYEQAVAKKTADLGALDELTVNNLIYAPQIGGFGYAVPGSLLDLGLKLDDAQASAAAGDTISAENIDQLDADVLVIFDPTNARASLEADPLFQELPAVKSGAVIWTDPKMGFATTAANGPLSLDFLFEQVEPALRAAMAAQNS